MGSKTKLQYHLILTTKYRRPALLGVEQEVYRVFREVESMSSFKILAMGIEDGNHIHLAIQAPPKYSISSLVNRIKGMTLRRCWDDQVIAERLRRHYWGPSRKLWHGAYYCATTGEVSAQNVLAYVRGQNGPDEIGREGPNSHQRD